MRELISEHWNQTFVEKGPGVADGPGESQIQSVLVGHSLARSLVWGERNLEGKDLDPEKRKTVAEGMEWIKKHMRPEVLPEEFLGVYRQFELSLNFIRAAQWIWQGLPVEVKAALRENARFEGTEDVEYSPMLLARALAHTLRLERQSERQRESEEYSRRGGSMYPPRPTWRSSKLLGIGDLIRDRMEALFHEVKAGTKDPDQEVQIFGELLQEFQFSLVRETIPEIVEGLDALDPRIVTAILSAGKDFMPGVQEEMPELPRHIQEMRTMGRGMGDYLSERYVGILTYGVQREIFSAEEWGIPQETLQEWNHHVFSRPELEKFLEELGRDSTGPEEYRELFQFVLNQRKQWGGLHPFSLGVAETFRVGENRFDTEEKLTQIIAALHRIEHAPALRVLRQAPSGIRSLVMNNFIHLKSPEQQDLTMTLARAIALTMAQSHGLTVAGGLDSGEFRSGAAGQSVSIQRNPPPLSPHQSRSLQSWLTALSPELRKDPGQVDFLIHLMFEITQLSAPTIFGSLEKLPAVVQVALRGEIPAFFPPRGDKKGKPLALKTLGGELQSLGQVLGYFLHEGYVTTYRMGEERGWLDPKKFGLDLAQEKDFSETDSRVGPREAVTEDFIHTLLKTQDWFFYQINGWGGMIHPLWQGFARAFYDGGLSKALPGRLKSGVEYLLKKMRVE